MAFFNNKSLQVFSHPENAGGSVARDGSAWVRDHCTENLPTKEHKRTLTTMRQPVLLRLTQENVNNNVTTSAALIDSRER